MKRVKKKERQQIIKRLIAEHCIESQEELMNVLKQENVTSTQATISRDMREMNIAKAYGKNGRPYYLIYESTARNLEDKIAFSLREYLKSISQVEFMVVVRTAENGADVIANYLDEIRMVDIVGTIAGFDILLIITSSKESAENVVSRLNYYLKDYQFASHLYNKDKVNI